ncbi:uncharacterized protein N7477_009767 [Penicillium maclennaniae]|uniref:uncharacterized protein n=1 Tax=Penicillium maclennaniae TaxID=1343394 RepID=UPI00254215D3|nr:uncharacterized protein N7477_009767 [Penicillium maclennaniae]KAJ5662151.1 hypothetical protein N7477_009767 [Penicillium maclennaniae]
MAAVFIPPSPRTSVNMSTRRPLANVPNATNSPHRAGLLPAKRARSGQLEIPYGQPPPKKQVMDAVDQETRSPSRNRSTAYQSTESKLFSRRSNNPNPSAFEKKLVAAREKDRTSQLKTARGEKPSTDTMDTIRQWQRHYRKAFPQFVFYFDSIPEDVRRKFSRQVVALGAREEKFFSRLVTHVVTSRPIPPEASTTPTEETATGTDGEANMQTVNPSLLEKNGDAHLQPSLKNDTRRDQGTMDVLQRARQMGMKIWALEKLQRMITTINDNDIGGQNDASRSKAAATANGRGENDLSRVLRQEALNGPSDRDPLSSMELCMFKGPFVYIHDMNEKTKPVMVREYAKVTRRQDGVWPQFRSAPLGKCPFIDEPPSRKEFDRHRMRQIQKEKKSALQNMDDHRTKASAAAAERAIDTNLVTELHKPKRSEEQQPHQPEAPAKALTDESHERKSSESFIPPHFPEPAPSTPAMISSTAAAPGAKAGLSKEVHGLKRKVLEKGSGIGSMAAPQRPINGSAVPVKAQTLTKPIVHEKNGRSQEDSGNQVDAAGTKRRRDEDQDNEQKKPERRRDPKPGYCENCRDKFDDFEEHTLTRKHRRFAQNTANWAELDALLFEIQRPLKEEYEFDD